MMVAAYILQPPCDFSQFQPLILIAKLNFNHVCLTAQVYFDHIHQFIRIRFCVLTFYLKGQIIYRISRNWCVIVPTWLLNFTWYTFRWSFTAFDARAIIICAFERARVCMAKGNNELYHITFDKSGVLILSTSLFLSSQILHTYRIKDARFIPDRCAPIYFRFTQGNVRSVLVMMTRHKCKIQFCYKFSIFPFRWSPPFSKSKSHL